MNTGAKIQAELQRAVEMHRAGDLQAAERIYRRVLQFNPNQHDALNLLALVMQTFGRKEEALDLLGRAIQAAPKFAEAHFNKAKILSELQKFDPAIQHYQKAIALSPGYADAQLNLGALFFEQGQLTDAEQTLRRMTQTCSGDLRGFYNLGRVLAEQFKWTEACAAFASALKLNPQHVDSLIMLAKSHAADSDFSLAIETLQRAIAEDPSHVIAWTNLGVYQLSCGNSEAAISAFDRALELAPSDINAKVNRGLANLAIGRLEPGWAEYSLRSKATGSFKFHRRNLPWPQWQGQSLESKSIFVWGEQGLGDEILYASFIPDLLERASRVTVAVSPRLLSLFQRSFPKASVISLSDIQHFDSEIHFDFHSALLDLGQWLRPALRSFPNRKSYILADPVRVHDIRDELASLFPQSQFRVGFSWRSLAAHIGPQKTPDLAVWAPLLEKKHLALISLQYGPAALIQKDAVRFAQDHGAQLHIPRIDFGAASLDELAAYIAGVDLVVTVSNTTAHISAALGVPTLVLLGHPRGSLWYWLKGGAFSPWYRHVRLSRSVDEISQFLGSAVSSNRELAVISP